MEYREMAQEMREDEVDTLLKILFPYARMLNFYRERETNFISVVYTLPEDENKEYHLHLLPDDVYLLGNDTASDGELLEDGNAMYQYRQFMVARGYSELWLNNVYIEI